MIFFSMLNSERICGGTRSYNYHLPSNLLPHYLAKCKWSTIQLYNTVNLVQSDEKRLIMVNIYEGYYFFVFLHGQIYVMCLKCQPSAHMRVLTRECHWSMDVPMCSALFNGLPNVYLRK